MCMQRSFHITRSDVEEQYSTIPYETARDGATILRVGGTNISASETSRKFFAVYPHICHAGGYNSYKEKHTERHISDSVAAISYWSCSCIYRPINKHSNW